MDQSKFKVSKVSHDKSIAAFIDDKSNQLVSLYDVRYETIEDAEIPSKDNLICKVVLSIEDNYVVFDVHSDVKIASDDLTFLYVIDGINYKMPAKILSHKVDGETKLYVAKIPYEYVKLQYREYQRFQTFGWIAIIDVDGQSDKLRGKVADVSYSGFKVVTGNQAEISAMRSVQVRIKPNIRNVNFEEIVLTGTAIRRHVIGEEVYIGFTIDSFHPQSERRFTIAINHAERSAISVK